MDPAFQKRTVRGWDRGEMDCAPGSKRLKGVEFEKVGSSEGVLHVLNRDNK